MIKGIAAQKPPEISGSTAICLVVGLKSRILKELTLSAEMAGLHLSKRRSAVSGKKTNA